MDGALAVRSDGRAGLRCIRRRRHRLGGRRLPRRHVPHRAAGGGPPGRRPHPRRLGATRGPPTWPAPRGGGRAWPRWWATWPRRAGRRRRVGGGRPRTRGCVRGRRGGGPRPARDPAVPGRQRRRHRRRHGARAVPAGPGRRRARLRRGPRRQPHGVAGLDRGGGAAARGRGPDGGHGGRGGRTGRLRRPGGGGPSRQHRPHAHGDERRLGARR